MLDFGTQLRVHIAGLGSPQLGSIQEGFLLKILHRPVHVIFFCLRYGHSITQPDLHRNVSIAKIGQ